MLKSESGGNGAAADSRSRSGSVTFKQTDRQRSLQNRWFTAIGNKGQGSGGRALVKRRKKRVKAFQDMQQQLVQGLMSKRVAIANVQPVVMTDITALFTSAKKQAHVKVQAALKLLLERRGIGGSSTDQMAISKLPPELLLQLMHAAKKKQSTKTVAQALQSAGAAMSGGNPAKPSSQTVAGGFGRFVVKKLRPKEARRRKARKQFYDHVQQQLEAQAKVLGIGFVYKELEDDTAALNVKAAALDLLKGSARYAELVKQLEQLQTDIESFKSAAAGSALEAKKQISDAELACEEVVKPEALLKLERQAAALDKEKTELEAEAATKVRARKMGAAANQTFGQFAQALMQLEVLAQEIDVFRESYAVQGAQQHSAAHNDIFTKVLLEIAQVAETLAITLHYLADTMLEYRIAEIDRSMAHVEKHIKNNQLAIKLLGILFTTTPTRLQQSKAIFESCLINDEREKAAEREELATKITKVFQAVTVDGHVASWVADKLDATDGLPEFTLYFVMRIIGSIHCAFGASDVLPASGQRLHVSAGSGAGGGNGKGNPVQIVSVAESGGESDEESFGAADGAATAAGNGADGEEEKVVAGATPTF